MANDGRKRKRQRVPRFKLEEEEIKSLLSRIELHCPKQGSLSGLGNLKKFVELPLSQYTLDGLKRGGFEFMTDIQRNSIIHALAGRDVIAAAKTGSGKTLSFLVPLLEKLYLSKWTPEIGIGAIVITPTRELALQIYEVLRVIGFKHALTVGLFIGSGNSKINNFSKEQMYASLANVVICTPGRFLQHLEQTHDLNTSETKLLVLDEADRLLDMGFMPQLTKILEYLPQPITSNETDVFDPFRRQTLLFSATQNSSIEKLSKLSMANPERIFVHKTSEASTPNKLFQIYSEVDPQNKLKILYSFLRSHLKSKIICFFSSCKQVQFVDSAFRKLQPGIKLMSIHGKLKQKARMDTYYDFVDYSPLEEQNKKKREKDSNKKKKTEHGACLFATDIVARGLDFPSVDWVIQVDCPESVDMYIHRVGRTARYRFNGKALLLVTPDESKEFINLLKQQKVPIFKKDINQARVETSSKGIDLTKKLAAEVAKDNDLKVTAQKAFKSYIRSVHLQPNKKVFNAKKLPLAAIAKSFGLISTPRVRISGDGGIKDRVKLRKEKNAIRIPSKEIADVEEKEKVTTKWERLLKRKQIETSKVDVDNVFEDDTSSLGDDENFLSHKQTLQPIEEESNEVDEHFYQSAKARKKLKLGKDGVKRGKVRGVRTVFNESGEAVSEFELLVQQRSEKKKNEFLADATSHLKENEEQDKLDEKERIRAKKLKKKQLKKQVQREVEEEEVASEDEEEMSSNENLEEAALQLIQ